MKTTKQVIEQSGISPKLIRSTIRQIGDKDSLKDVYNHGADAGYCGFTYYSDTVSFYKRNKSDILELLKEQAENCGYYNVIAMVKSFNCLNDVNEDEIGKTLFGTEKQWDTNIANALAWYALEEVARAFCDY